MKVFVFIGVHSWLALSCLASPLDDLIAAYKTAPTQNEAAVSAILASGLKEGRSAQAFIAVKPWLDAQPAPSPALLWQAGQVSERAGEGPAAVSFYRKLLKNPGVDAQVAASAAPAAYRLLINHLGDADAAYLLMREDGDRLRTFGRARQFDDWFIAQAKARGDVPALSQRLVAIIGADATKVGPHTSDLEWTCGQLETFMVTDDAALESARTLAAAPNLPASFQARLRWALEITPFSRQATELFKAKKPVPETLYEKPLRAAEALVAALPFDGSQLVAKGWMNYRDGHTPNVLDYLSPRREAKVAPILKALPALTPAQAQAVLAAPGCPQGRPVSLLFSPAELRALAGKLPAVFNSLAAPNAALYDKTLTVAEAKTLAPLLARNPHADAALVRAVAATGSNATGPLAAAMVKSELWRFPDAPSAVLTARNRAAEREGKRDEAVQANAAPDARSAQLAKDIDKAAASPARIAAGNALQADLLGANPAISGSLTLWDNLFAGAPEADAVTMLRGLLAQFDAEREALLHRALAKAQVGGHALFWMPELSDNYLLNTKQRARYITAAAPLVADLQRLLAAQVQAGTLSDTALGIWLHAVDPKDPSAQAFLNTLLTSPAYAKVSRTFHTVAADSLHFGPLALTPVLAARDAGANSRELLALPKDAPPAAVEAALKAVLDRATAAPAVMPVIGLRPVAALPAWSEPTRTLVLSLFRENAPLGAYPAGQGYEALVVRVANEAREAKRWGTLEPLAAGLWHAAATRDEPNAPGAVALSLLAEAALKTDAPSIAATFARSALRGPAGRELLPRQDWGYPVIATRVRGVSGKAVAALGAAEIPVDETDPAYPVYKSHAEFVQGNADTAWELHVAHSDRLQPLLLRKLTLEYAFWLLRRNVEADRSRQAEDLVKELTIWSREAPGTFSPEQEARLKIAYANLAFRKGALPTARAWYRKVADAAEYNGSEMQLEAALGSVRVDRVSRNFSTALTELDKLMRLRQPEFRLRVHYARAEVLMDQENYKEALGEIDAVLRQQPKHADAMILRGRIHYQMRKLVEASEIELGPSQEETSIVPGMALKINLRDPTLGVSGLGADIEVEVSTKSGDRERVLLFPLGDSKDKFRAELPTALGPATPGDKTLQVLGEDEIRYGYSKEFRAKMADLPADPDTVIGVAADATLDLTAGAFPPRAGERRLDVEELGLSSAQAALGIRAVRPGNNLYLRLTDFDQGKTGAPDRAIVSLQASSGDEIRRVELTETGPFTGEFQAVVPTAGAQALAFASESAPGRDPNMVISGKDYPGWQGAVGDKEKIRTFGIDLNDNVALGRMNIDTGGPGQALTRFVLQTSLNGKDWVTRARQPVEAAPWDGRPRIASVPTYVGGVVLVGNPKDREPPVDWREIMELTSARASLRHLSAHVPNLSAKNPPLVDTGHPGYPALIQFRALFYQPSATVRRFQLAGLPATDEKGVTRTLFLIDGKPADKISADPFVIEREFAPGLHEIEVWCHESRGEFLKRSPRLLCDAPGQSELTPCPDALFDPATFPEAVRAALPRPASVKTNTGGGLDVAFGDSTRARMVRLVILGFEGVAPSIHKITLADRAGTSRVPVAQDYLSLRENQQLEVLPGDRITVRYLDPRPATPGRDRHERHLGVAFNNGRISASFLNYTNTPDGQRVLQLEPLRRFRFSDPVAVVIDDPDLDGSPDKDTVEFTVTSSGGEKVTLKALETEEHSGQFIGRVFPVEGAPQRPSEIRLTPGGTLTATYRDTENLDPGIPADRMVTIGHAQVVPPLLSAYTQASEPLPPVEAKPADKPLPAGSPGPEVILPRRTLAYTPVGAEALASAKVESVIGSTLRFDVVIPHLAFAGSSTINAYVQTEAARVAAAAAGPAFDVRVPGTLKISGTLGGGGVTAPAGYQLTRAPIGPTRQPPLEEGRFSFAVPLILGDPPARSFATKDAADLPASALPDGLAVKSGDIVHVALPWQDAQQKVQWITTRVTVGSHAVLDVLTDGYAETLSRAYVGKKSTCACLPRASTAGRSATSPKSRSRAPAAPPRVLRFVRPSRIPGSSRVCSPSPTPTNPRRPCCRPWNSTAFRSGMVTS